MSKPVGRRMARRVLFLSGMGAIVFGSALPGALFADSVEDGPRSGQRFAAASADNAETAPPRAFSGSVGEVEHTAPSGQVKKPATFDMSHAERVRIRVLGNSDLSGEYAIDHDHSLSIPRIGRIEVGTMSPAELEQMLTQKLSASMRIDTTVAVEIVRFRPYFIMGQVADGGAIEWRPGLKVIQAISLARGVLRSAAGDAGPASGLSNRQSRTQLTFALAQIARLKAEREGADIVATTERVASLISSVPETSRMALTSLIGRQNDMLREQRDIMDARLIGLQREREAAAREVDVAEQQVKTISEQVDITRAQFADIERLMKKQLVNKPRYFDQKSSLLLIELRYAEAHTLVERARARLSSIEQQLAMVPQQRRADLNERIDTLEREVAQLELASGITAGGDDDEGDVLKLSYHIARESGSGVQTIPATVFTDVMPGDVLIVGKGQDGTGTSQPRVNSAKEASAADRAQSRIEQTAISAPSVWATRRATEMGARVQN